MKARGTSWSERPVRPAALALRTKVIANRARSGDRKGVAIASSTPPEARTATFGDTNNESAIGRPHNRNRSLNGRGQAQGGHDAKQSFDVHAFLPFDRRHAACCCGSQKYISTRAFAINRSPTCTACIAQTAMPASLLESRAETRAASQGAGLNPNRSLEPAQRALTRRQAQARLDRGAQPDNTHVKGARDLLRRRSICAVSRGRPIESARQVEAV
jgi:hypothetical protein